MNLNKCRTPSNVTPDLFDSLQTLWDHFASGVICVDDDQDELIVNCPSCNEEYSRNHGPNVFCDECRPGRNMPWAGLRLVHA